MLKSSKHVSQRKHFKQSTWALLALMRPYLGLSLKNKSAALALKLRGQALVLHLLELEDFVDLSCCITIEVRAWNSIKGAYNILL